MKQIMKQVGMMVACVFALAQVGDAWAADANPPERMTYQGYLVDGNGAPLGDSVPANYDVVFRIYNIKTGGATDNILWAEQQTVTVDKGYFTVLLGEGVASANGDPNGDLSAVFAGSDASDRFIGITIKGLDDSDLEIAPRLRLVASPFTFLAAYARQADKIVGTGGDVLTTDGGNIGIGNATPNSKLDVGGDIKASGAVDVGGNANVQGQLAVGKSSAPTAALDVTGTIKASSGLDIDGDSTIDGSLTVRPTGSSSALRINASSIYSGYQLKLWNDDSASYIRNDSDSRKIIIGANNRSTLALTPDGKVGINNSSPSYDLDVDGTIRASSLIVDGSLTVPGLTLNGWVGRTAHNNGALVGSYNNVGGNSLKTNPIYVIGSNYKPADSTLSNMYGVGFTDGGASFITGLGSGWGFYVASDGDARTWLSGTSGAVSYINKNGGKVGIGTDTPGAMLDVNGTVSAKAYDMTVLTYQHTGASVGGTLTSLRTLGQSWTKSQLDSSSTTLGYFDKQFEINSPDGAICEFNYHWSGHISHGQSNPYVIMHLIVTTDENGSNNQAKTIKMAIESGIYGTISLKDSMKLSNGKHRVIIKYRTNHNDLIRVTDDYHQASIEVKVYGDADAVGSGWVTEKL